MEGLAAGLTIADRFVLVRRLGRGATAEVWLAEERDSGARVALKCFDPARAGADGGIEQLRHQYARIQALSHPNILRVFDIFSDGGRAFVSLQYIDGDTLLAARGEPFQQIVRQSLMVCDALDSAHRAGIVHRDCKPANVLVDASGVCYLTDFSVVPVARTAGHGGGTLPSMSPQQLDGDPPAVSDDIYALGALCYDLLTGAPLFHPDVTPARIRDERPPALDADGTGQSLPAALSGLVAAMLEKSAAHRPAGIGAVRSVLEEIRQDYPEPSATGGAAAIQPIRRRVAEPGSAPPPRRIENHSPGASPKWVFAGLAVLVMLALAVVFLLPDAVRERQVARAPSPEPAAPAATPGDASPPAAVAQGVQREIADEVLGQLLVSDDRLRSIGVETWGGADWARARALAADGDAAYRARDYGSAVDLYRQALTQMELIEPRAAAVLAGALTDGDAALSAGDAARATDRYQLALTVEPTNQHARAGLARAARLDEVMALMARATDREEAGDLSAAAKLYEQVLGIDSQWSAAQAGLRRVRGALAQHRYETGMAAGQAALLRRDFDAARRAFEAALAARPGDADAQAALRQAGDEAQLVQIERLRERARAAEAGEDWAGAVASYERILAADPAVATARRHLERARSRLQLGERLDDTLTQTDEFNAARVAAAARDTLALARAIAEPGPVLQRQIDTLAESLRIAAIPVPVRFRSDNQTNVVIYKVGPLGMFETRTLELKPGRYVAVGSRSGYRDVRRSFRVGPDGVDAPIELSCKEPI